MQDHWDRFVCRVLGANEAFFPGKIQKVFDNGQYAVLFDDGDTAKIDEANIKLKGGAAAPAPLPSA